MQLNAGNVLRIGAGGGGCGGAADLRRVQRLWFLL